MADPAEKQKPAIITVFNQKGGVGKTTTSVNLAVCIAALGRQTVLIDLDSQSNATTNVGVTPPVATGAYQVLTARVGIDEALRKTPYENLRLVGGSDELAWADIELATRDECQDILARALDGLPAGIEVVVVDCPPAPGIVSVNALVAADVVIMPVMPSPHALDGLHKAWWNVNRVRKAYNRDLQSVNILLTMTEDGAMTSRLTEDIIAEFGARVMPVLVPRDNVVIEAAARDLPVVAMAPQAAPSRAYLRVADLVLTRALSLTGAGPESRLGADIEPDIAAGRLAEWAARQGGETARLKIPEPGQTPDPGWTEEEDDDLTPPPLAGKVAASLGLLLMGAVLGGAAVAAFFTFAGMGG